MEVFWLGSSEKIRVHGGAAVAIDELIPERGVTLEVGGERVSSGVASPEASISPPLGVILQVSFVLLHEIVTHNLLKFRLNHWRRKEEGEEKI